MLLWNMTHFMEYDTLYLYLLLLLLYIYISQYFSDTVGWVTGRASGL